MENVEFFDMCMCIVFAFQLIRAKEVRIDIELKRSEEKWREVMTCDVSPVAMFNLEGPFQRYLPKTSWNCTGGWKAVENSKMWFTQKALSSSFIQLQF